MYQGTCNWCDATADVAVPGVTYRCAECGGDLRAPMPTVIETEISAERDGSAAEVREIHRRRTEIDCRTDRTRAQRWLLVIAVIHVISGVLDSYGAVIDAERLRQPLIGQDATAIVEDPLTHRAMTVAFRQKAIDIGEYLGIGYAAAVPLVLFATWFVRKRIPVTAILIAAAVVIAVMVIDWTLAPPTKAFVILANPFSIIISNVIKLAFLIVAFQGVRAILMERRLARSSGENP